MLNKVVAKNFLSWKELSFNVTSGVTLIDGWNEDDGRSEGSGKSAVLNAISWAIFGKLPKDANIDEVIKDGETSCSVVLDFDNGDSIVRSRKPNELYISKNGVIVKGKDAKETQSFIEEYIGCNFETFCQSVYFAQNYDKKFLSSNQAEKGKILSSIQNLQIFDKARKETMDLIKSENENVSKLKNQIQIEENNLSNLTSQKSLVDSFIKDKISKHQQQVSMMNHQRDLVSGNIKRTESDLQSVSDQLRNIDLAVVSNDETELTEAKNQYATQLSAVSYKKSQFDTLKKTVVAKESEGRSLAQKYENLQIKKQTASNINESPQYLRLHSELKRLAEFEATPTYSRLLKKKADLELFLKNPSKICPSCGNELKNIDTSHVTNELSSVISEMDSIKVSSANDYERVTKDILAFEIQFKKDYESIDDELANVLTQLEAISLYLDANPVPSVEELTAQESQIRGVISEIDGHLRNVQQRKLDHSKLSNQFSALSNQLKAYQTQLEQIQDSIKNLGSPDIGADQDKLKTITLEMGIVSSKLSELKNLLNASDEHLRRLESLKDGFKEIKSYVFVNALNELNFRTNQYLNELFEMEASIKFSNVEQDIETKITVDGNSRSLGLLSGGQNRRFNLAVDLALADIVSYRKTSKLDIIVFDEYFKDLSEISMEKSLDLLKTKKCPVILIEHNTAFKNIIDNTFFVRLRDGTSFEDRP